MISAVTVFCGSRLGASEEYAASAAELGTLLAKSDLRLVYGGAKVGLMGVLADACLAAGGYVIGVMPQALVDKEIAHTGLSELHVVQSMHQRKALMADLADAFIALPGGFGTFEEVLEATTWTQLGLQRKACALLNVRGFYDGLQALITHASEEGFIKPQHQAAVLVDSCPKRLLHALTEYEAPSMPTWLAREER
jgi:uncharacterized protein (TIGR00730 family)